MCRICADQGQLTASYEAVQASSELQVQNVWQKRANCKDNIGPTIFVASAILVDIFGALPAGHEGNKTALKGIINRPCYKYQ